ELYRNVVLPTSLVDAIEFAQDVGQAGMECRKSVGAGAKSDRFPKLRLRISVVSRGGRLASPGERADSDHAVRFRGKFAQRVVPGFELRDHDARLGGCL